jgi:hypothetical protein
VEKKYSLILDDDFVTYCKINNITNIEKKAKETFESGFLFLKYGVKPKTTILPQTEINNQPLNIDKEPITEKIIKKNPSIYDE